MNATQLLARFDRLAEAPNAVPRLRSFILDLAVRGKLVEQDAGDEPAVELMKRIQTGRNASKKALAGSLARVLDVESFAVGYELPSSWQWEELGNLVTTMDAGWSPQCESHPRRGLEMWGVLKTTAVQPLAFDCSQHKELPEKFKPRPGYEAQVGDILITRAGPKNRVGVSCVVDKTEPRLMISDKLIRFHLLGDLDPFFCALALNAGYSNQCVEDAKSGMAVMQMNISQDRLKTVPLPIPPLAEQHRIVAKVDELMALCDQLEAAQQERERRRDRLAAASLQRLNQPAEDTTHESQREHARFHLRNLPRLTTRPEHIKAMRKLILDSAIKGKLVAQDPVDEPANELIKRIHDRKLALTKHKLLKADKPLPPIRADEKRFILPNGWGWCRLGNLAHFVTSGSRDWAKHYSDTGPIFVRMGNLSRDSYQLRMANVQRVNPPKGGEGKRTSLEAGDVLISITGEVGLLGLIPPNFGEAYINQHTCMVRPSPELSSRYLPELFRSTFAQAQFDAPQRGLKNSFRLTDVTEFLVPLPPLAEQYRIVAKIDELMALCDQLETQLTTTQTDSRRLLEAVLEAALLPA